ncbi:YciI family protein [Acidipropionibacterium timonense]|uniref:YciI family protein n=1 Tax=Acidipropionibacterium timonense TaxID=2161818 RepID=UPI00103228FE|nr:YciI family protein [Acidipropionibacterium timonense]
MARYLLSVFAPAQPGPYGPYESAESMSAALAATADFNSMLQREGYFVFAGGLAPIAAATTVDGQGERPIITDGPHAQAAEYVGGFWVIDVPDLDVALGLAAQGSKACRGVVEVRPFARLPR